MRKPAKHTRSATPSSLARDFSDARSGPSPTKQSEGLGPLSGVWFDICAYPTDGGLSVYSRDITERKEAEQRVVEAREAERRRIARALHDEALQGLGDAIALAAMVDRTAAESRLADRLLPVLQRVGEQLRGAINDLRLESEEHLPFVDGPHGAPSPPACDR